MAIKDISTAWKDDLKDRAFPTERIYIDFRQEIYPPYTGEMIYADIIDGIRLGELTTGDWRHREIADGILIGETIAGTVST